MYGTYRVGVDVHVVCDAHSPPYRELRQQQKCYDYTAHQRHQATANGALLNALHAFGVEVEAPPRHDGMGSEMPRRTRLEISSG